MSECSPASTKQAGTNLRAKKCHEPSRVESIQQGAFFMYDALNSTFLMYQVFRLFFLLSRFKVEHVDGFEAVFQQIQHISNRCRFKDAAWRFLSLSIQSSKYFYLQTRHLVSLERDPCARSGIENKTVQEMNVKVKCKAFTIHIESARMWICS